MGMLQYKTALNRYRSPIKSCIVIRQFGVNKLLRVVLGDSYAQVMWYCARALKFVASTMGKRYFSPITAYLIPEAELTLFLLTYT